ncbi:MAG: NAD(P)-dependent alcohol dehydrogenase [Chromatiaceae bacterium]|nr:MAG: NAD(P)-dependent alcohol dehydrogenase [Chromatiaceae bacterium]
MPFNAYAATAAGAPLTPHQFEPGPLGARQVQVRVESCGICHSDLSMIHNEWGMTQFPLVPGHEVVGIIEAVGSAVEHLALGQRVGVGWFSGSCQHCHWCLSGHHNLCAGVEGILIGRPGGFADRVQVDALWAVPLPAELDPVSAGPLFCGGITVFSPIVECGVRPTDRVGVVGIGGLGHLALQFLRAWGCEVTAFSSTPAKAEAARALGAHDVIDARDPAALAAAAGRYDFILVTVNVPLDWEAYLALLRPQGRLHVVGAVLEPIAVQAFSLLAGQKSLSASPLGSPATVAQMLDFAARHGIAPRVKTYPFAEVNAALAELARDRPAHRLVLTH